LGWRELKRVEPGWAEPQEGGVGVGRAQRRGVWVGGAQEGGVWVGMVRWVEPGVGRALGMPCEKPGLWVPVLHFQPEAMQTEPPPSLGFPISSFFLSKWVNSRSPKGHEASTGRNDEDREILTP
jgi:hypothetical protein